MSKESKPIIVADAHIPLLKGMLDDVCEMRYLPAKGITPEVVRDADALLVRTRTRCNAQLLDGSRVRFIGTATIGFDHIDGAYCQAQGIQWISCPGCNADSVLNYIDSVWRYTIGDIKGKTVGVIGAGHVGSRIVRRAQELGARVLISDPPLGHFDLELIQKEADIITLHVPYDATTHHLVDAAFLAACRPDALLINAARGPVCDTEALLHAPNPIVLDCWESEPDINRQLLEKVILGTPHIAGYSIDGKANATQRCVDALVEFFQLGERRLVRLPDTEAVPYDVRRDSQALKQAPEHFEQHRNQYPIRRDWLHYTDL